MRYDLTDFEWSVIEPLLPRNQPGFSEALCGRGHVGSMGGWTFTQPVGTRRETLTQFLTSCSLIAKGS